MNNENFTHSNGIVKETAWLLATVVVNATGALKINSQWTDSCHPFVTPSLQRSQLNKGCTHLFEM